MKKRNKNQSPKLEDDIDMNDAEPNTPSNETLEQSADLAEKIVAKLTGAKPFESDCAMVDARINESSCNSQLLRLSLIHI